MPLIAIAFLTAVLGGSASGTVNADPAGADGRCQVTTARPTPAAAKAGGPVAITADRIEFPGRNVVRLHGNTELSRGGHRVFADELLYDKTSGEVQAIGAVRFETPKGDVIRTPVLHYDIASKTAESGPATFVLASRDPESLSAGRDLVSAHGAAQRVQFQGEDVMFMENVDITTCLDGQDDATFTADSLKIDLEEGFRVAKRAKVQILAPQRHPEIEEEVLK